MTRSSVPLAFLFLLLSSCSGSSTAADTRSEESAGGDMAPGDATASGAAEGTPEELAPTDVVDETTAVEAPSGIVDVPGDGRGVGAVVSHSSTTPPYTRCEAQPATSCAECDQPGLTVAIRGSSSRTWRAGEYSFELTTEGHHIRCPITMPCQSTEPVACRAAEGAPRVMVETTGCGGPLERQAVTALRFASDACPSDLRVEAFRQTIRIGQDATTPRYRRAAACGGTCSSARIELSVR